MKKIIICLIITMTITSTVNAAEVPRESAPCNATNEAIVIVESFIGDILTEVQNGLGYADARAKSNCIFFNAWLNGQTNGYSYGELVDIANAAVKDDSLFDNGNAAKFLVSANAHAGLKLYLDIEADGHLVEATIKANGIHPYEGPKDLGPRSADGSGVIDDLLPKFGEIDANVLVAVLVAAGVKHTQGIDTDGVPLPLAIAGREGGSSIIRHAVFPLSWKL